MAELFSFVSLIYYIGLMVYVFFLLLLSTLFFRKYLQYKYRELFLFGLSFFILAGVVYIPFVISIFMLLILGQGLDLFVHAVAIGFSPIIVLTYLAAMSELIFKDKQKLILTIIAVLVAIIEIIHFYILFVYGPSYLGYKWEDGVSVSWYPFVIFYLAITLLIFIISSSIFAYKAYRTNDEENKLKGIILFLASIFFLFGSLFESVIVLTGFLSPITRILQILGASLYYIGFTLPKKIKKLFLE
ncbi:MAG: hypothetical protein GF353_05335 [Candidatus Lokiarchaeota archaeon]|nr:hypothetical protein [Candidatus Lokiarchaeota archaeon]